MGTAFAKKAICAPDLNDDPSRYVRLIITWCEARLHFTRDTRKSLALSSFYLRHSGRRSRLSVIQLLWVGSKIVSLKSC